MTHVPLHVTLSVSLNTRTLALFSQRDLADRTRKDVTRDAKLLRMSKEITKLKRERVRDAKKRRELLARRQRRIVQNKKRSTGRSASNRSYSQLHANRASRVAAQAEEQSKNLREMHRRRRNIELRIHRLEQEKDAAMQVSVIAFTPLPLYFVPTIKIHCQQKELNLKQTKTKIHLTHRFPINSTTPIHSPKRH